MQVPPPTSPAAAVVPVPQPNGHPAAPLAQHPAGPHGHPVGLALPDPGGAATNAMFQQVPRVPEPALSERLQDRGLKLSELRDMFNAALNGDEVDPDRPIGKLLYEIGARRGDTLDDEMKTTLNLQAALRVQDTPQPHDPRIDWAPMKRLNKRQQDATQEATLQLQAELRLHRMLFAALGSRLQDPDAQQLRLRGGLLIERLQHGWITDEMYRVSMLQLAEDYLALAEKGPYQARAIDPPRQGREARGAYLDMRELLILRDTRSLAQTFNVKHRITERDVPGSLTHQALTYSDDDPLALQKGVDYAALLFDFFSEQEGLPEDCINATRAIMTSRAMTSAQLQAAGATPPPDPSVNLPLSGVLEELAKKTALYVDSVAYDPDRDKHTVSLRELIDLLIYAHNGPECHRHQAYEQVNAMLRQAAETQGSSSASEQAGRALKKVLFAALWQRIGLHSTVTEKLKQSIAHAQDKLDRRECDYPKYQKIVRAVLLDFALSEEGQAGGVGPQQTP